MSAHLWPAAPPRPIKWVATSARLAEALPANQNYLWVWRCGSHNLPAPAGASWRFTIYGGAPHFVLFKKRAQSVAPYCLVASPSPRTSRKMMQLAAASLRALAPRVAPPAACTGAARELLGQGRFFPVHACHQRVISRGGCR